MSDEKQASGGVAIDCASSQSVCPKRADAPPTSSSNRNDEKKADRTGLVLFVMFYSVYKYDHITNESFDL